MGPGRDQRDRRARLHADHRGNGAASRHPQPARSRRRTCSAPRATCATLKSKLPARIPEPDRTWLALAAFNIGLGHLEDARILAQKQKLNPDLWSDVKKVLPLLALPEYYERAKLGYARGGMPVAFVDRVRAYYDVLLAQQPPHEPRLRMFADAPEHGLAKFKPEFMKK